jgi:lipopolysaccharide transport system ATP-binding protein
MSGTLVKVEGVSKKFCRSLKKSLWYGVQDLGREITGRCQGGKGDLRPEEFWAIKDVSFGLERGECLGLVGRNGAGKTTLLRLLSGLIKPNQGRIEMLGKVGGLIALGAGFNPILTGRENIYVNASILGLSKRDIENKLDEIVEFAEIGEFIDAPVQTYSSGMQVRLGFAIASTLRPDILIIDEVLAVGDANFQSKCFQRIGKSIETSAVILVSHYPHHIKKMCDRVLLLDRGVAVEEGAPDRILAIYQQDQFSGDRKSMVLFGDEVRAAAVENVTLAVSAGHCLEFDLVINVADETQCAQSYLNLVDSNDIVHAQVVLSGLAKRFPTGLSRHRVKVGPLHLSTGRYSANLALYGSGGKTTIVLLRHCLNFEFEGATNLGPVYYPPSEVVGAESPQD